MPMINIKTNVSVSSEQENTIMSALGKSISLIRGKSEAWLMVGIDGGSSLCFREDKKTPCAFVNVSIYGSASTNEYEALTGAVTTLLNQQLGIRSDRIYVCYQETMNWGYSGHNF